MNALIESLNLWGARFFGFALPLFWQSSLLIAVVFAVDFLLRRKIRPAVRYTLWLVVFIKLLAPPTLALPTSAAWWLRTRKVQVVAPHNRTMNVSYSEPTEAFVPPRPPVAPLAPSRAKLSREAWTLLVSLLVSALLAAWSVFRWWQIAGCVRKTTAATGEIQEMLAEVRCRAGLRKIITLRLTAESMSPAVCGLFQPVVLLPQSLIDRLTPDQLRAVLLHELIHLRRRDVWVNCAQTLLQIVYWWHPLLWFANARVRQVREEAVDDAVMFALNEQAEIYAPTLLEVAKLAFNRPLATLGLVGILESRNALRHRIERLLNFTTPRRVGVSVVSVIGIAAFTALAVPMGEPPARVVTSTRASQTSLPQIKKNVSIEALIYQLPPDAVAHFDFKSATVHREVDASTWWALRPEQVNDLLGQIKNLKMTLLASPRIQTSDGTPASLFIGDPTNNIQLNCTPLIQDDEIELFALARTSGKYAPNGKGWPNMGDETNCAIFAHVKITSGHSILLRSEHPGMRNGDGLIMVLSAVIVADQTNSAVTAAHAAPENPTKSLLFDGEWLSQHSKWDEAEEKFNQVLALQPDNQAALYYLSLIKQQRIKEVVDAHNGATPKVIPNPYAGTNTIHTSAARQKLYEKLTSMRLDSVSYPGLTLAEVIRNLRTETKQRDPDQEGINFVLNRAKPQVAGVIGQPGQPQNFDPMTGQPIVTPLTTAIDDGDLATVTISLDPSLQNVRLMDVLEAIVKSSDHPIKYSLLDYGIEFSFKGPDVPELHTRTFKVDPKTFLLGLQNVRTLKPGVQATGGGGGSSGASGDRRYVTAPDPTTAKIQLAVINFFNAVGVNLSAPKSVFYNDHQGTLTVHATAEDLDLIEQAINTLNLKPPQVTVKARFVEVDADNKNLNALLGGILTNAPSSSTNSPVMCGILTETKLKSVLKAFEKRDHANLLNEGEVTTLSGRQANFQVVDVKTIVTGFTTTTNSSTPEVNTALTTNGTTVEVMSYVCADGYTIQMTATPAVTEFLGYADSEKSSKIVKTFKYPHQSFPASRVRTATISAIISDGQTLVLGHLSDELVVNELDGKELRRPFTDTKKKQLFVFITATIIDEVGNRVHSEDIHSRDYYDGPVF